MASIITRGLGFLARSAAPFIGRGVSALASAAKPYLGKMMSGPAGAIIKSLGPTAAAWAGEEAFMGAMRKFGNRLQHRVETSKLAPVLAGYNVGDQYYDSMKRVFNFVKNGGQMDIPGGGGDASVVEKMNPDSGTT